MTARLAPSSVPASQLSLLAPAPVERTCTEVGYLVLSCGCKLFTRRFSDGTHRTGRMHYCGPKGGLLCLADPYGDNGPHARAERGILAGQPLVPRTEEDVAAMRALAERGR